MAQKELDVERLLQLPAVDETVKEGKLSFASSPDTSWLIPAQKVVFDEVIALAKSYKPFIYVLKGYAGTGKTTVTAMIMEEILSTTSLRVAVTAPTNKAVRVGREQSKFSSQVLNLGFSTIHSLLGLKEHIDGHGRQTFKKQRDLDVKIDQYNIIIVDESSMLADELFNELLRYIDMYNLGLVFVGDPAQIPPVNQGEFTLFTEKGETKHKAHVGELTEVLRQAADNPIIQVTMKIRNALGRDIVLPTRDDSYDPETMDGLFFFDTSDRDLFYDVMRTYFTSENFRQDADFMKIIAWTNKTVNTFNKIVRKMIYGVVDTKICIGEKLIANKPILDEKIILFTTNDEFEVVSYTQGSGNYKGVEFHYYLTVVRDSEGNNKTIKIIHEESQGDYDLVIEHLASLAKAEKQGSYQASSRWIDFFSFQTIFADVNYNYAITAHKSQGSTYGNVMVLEADIDQNRKIIEKNRIKYTAFTRAKHKLFIVV